MNGFDWHKTLWRLFEGTVLIGLGLAVHAANHEAKVPFVGIPVCDVLLGGGLQDDNLIIVAGFPGMGKSGLLETIVCHVAKNYHVKMFTLEMSNREQTDRMASQMTGIAMQSIRSGKLNDTEWGKVTQAVEDIGNLKLSMDEGSYLTFPALRAKCVRDKSLGKLDLVVLDYAGLMEAPGHSPYERATYLSRNLKQLAKELHVPLLAAHQLNRKAQEQDRPSMHNLRDSGSWEQDSDLVLLIYESEVAMSMDFAPRTLRLDKQRNGPTGEVAVAMRRATTKFESTLRTVPLD